MKEIELTHGKVALVDDRDYPFLSQYHWFVTNKSSHPYAIRYFEGKRIYMHRLIAGALPSVSVDHKNSNTLDNRRRNLRIVTQAQNMANQRKHRDSKSPYKGIRPVNSGGWTAKICVNGKNHYLGFFKDPLKAALAYDKAAREMVGKFARLNFPKRGEQ